MKLLIYSHFFAPNIGGVETVVQSLACGLAELRGSNGSLEFEITLVTQTPRGNFDDATLPFPVVREPGFFHLWRLIRSSDVVHAAGPALAPLLLARLARKPLVIEHHGYQATCPNGLLFHHPTRSVCPGHFAAGNYLECWNCNSKTAGSWGALRLLASTFLRRAGVNRAAMNIAPSLHVASRQGLPRTTVIAHGVQDPVGKTAAKSQEKNTFAYLGRLVAEKGVSLLLEAARLVRSEGQDIRVALIGDGPERVRLEKQIMDSHLESTVRITGFLSPQIVERELEDVRAVVIPTIMEETAGLAAIEQMMRGRPVIASAIGGLEEIVDGAGLTFRPGDPAALAKAMLRILKEPDLGSCLAERGRERALQSYSFGAMIDGHA
ncbi:MAG TPA: glycosyltransferase family 4 protein, partial [Candidatus Acidoferrum sp.]|nr:glycosyltransferase family 4 protein [Candidatus Acidoferrum sp.]